jgi:hypothetical protein
LIDAWQAGCQNLWLAAHTNDYSLRSIRCRQANASASTASFAEESFSTAPTGSRANPTGQALAPWLCVCVTEYTSLASRRARGRFFVSGGWEADLNQDNWEAAYMTLVTAYADSLLSVFGPLGTNTNFDLVVWSRLDAGDPPINPGAAREVNRVVVRPQLSTQRSRRPERVFA